MNWAATGTPHRARPFPGPFSQKPTNEEAESLPRARKKLFDNWF
jgi:hypothetical protein